MSLTCFYFFSSFQAILPWTQCDPEWLNCFNTGDNYTGLNLTDQKSSVELYFTNDVLKMTPSIDDGIGDPEWRLVLCLLFSWIIVCLILIKGVTSSGKAAYFTAIFPYVVLITLLIRGVTLEGAADGILFFITPQWDKILEPQVWYAAVTQCFFSLCVGFGPIIMFSSYNPFRHNIYRDATVVSFMDTFTSLLAGVTIFAILGNLAHESGKNIEEVVQGGTGLAFISYPEAIAKFNLVPQLFAVLFFLMLFTLGVGSATALTGCVITIICDAFPHFKRWMVTVVISVVGFIIGLVYITPGGQYILDVVDFFGGGFIIFVLAVIETVAICWIYGLNKFLKDVEFMLGIRLGIYWQFSWGVFIPVALIGIFIYSLANFRVFQMGDYIYPTSVIVAGWVIAMSALIQVPLWGIYVVYKEKKGSNFIERLKNSFVSTDAWGPKDPKTRAAWLLFTQQTPDRTWTPLWLKKLFRSESFSMKPSNRNMSSMAIVQVEDETTSSSIKPIRTD
jgi:solute carrier family 6 amino acid transporter-like protein 5/7/9/14